MPILGIVSSGVIEQTSPAFESIASFNGTGSSNEFDFTNIPQTYKHLQLRIYGRCGDASADNARGFNMYLNNTIASEYAYYTFHSNSGGTISTENFYPASGAFVYCIAQSQDGEYGVGIIDFYDYADTSKHTHIKSLGGVAFGDSTYDRTHIGATSWDQTTAVNRIRMISNGGNLNSGTRVSLYGIKG